MTDKKMVVPKEKNENKVESENKENQNSEFLENELENVSGGYSTRPIKPTYNWK